MRTLLSLFMPGIPGAALVLTAALAGCSLYVNENQAPYPSTFDAPPGPKPPHPYPVDAAGEPPCGTPDAPGPPGPQPDGGPPCGCPDAPQPPYPTPDADIPYPVPDAASDPYPDAAR